MSGIAGIVRLDGAPASGVERLAAAIAHRGTDASGSWSEGPVALAHAMLHTTAESRAEPQPWIHDAIAIVADVRLDNREELLATLGMASNAGDAALIVAAYRRWGGDCAKHLDGDFAFALWDARERTLFCARDAVGVKPFVYALVPGKLFAFGSQARAVLAAPEVRRVPDEKRIADFLTFHFDDFERTFYEGVKRLPPASTLTLTGGRLTIGRYWSPNENAPMRRGSDAELAEGFFEHFARAMRVRMRVTDTRELGSFLSGGLDSTMISCFARDEFRRKAAGDLPVFSWIFSDAMQADERHYQEVAAASGGMQRHVLDSATAGYTPWSGLEQFLPDAPPFAPNCYINYGAGERAHAMGLRTMLDGLGGDSTVWRGNALFVELLLHGRFVKLARELRGMSRRHAISVPRLIFWNVLRPLAPRLTDVVLRVANGPQPPQLTSTLLRANVLALSGASTRARPKYRSVRAEHFAQMHEPMMAEGLELFDRIMSAAGVEGRYPFFDRRLIEYCLSLPADQKLSGGYSRIVARRAMQGIVPDEVLWRAGKGKPGLHIIKALADTRERLEDLFIRDPAVLAPYVDLRALRTAYERAMNEKASFPDMMMLWSIAALAEWLRSSST
ncbi:MAG: asparagine synthase-related protein [Acidobacteriota bacterium]|nr:asparagine synthase-related protein [Acidobacteriota bacterium]